jgi:hypothetical protein
MTGAAGWPATGAGRFCAIAGASGRTSADPSSSAALWRSDMSGFKPFISNDSPEMLQPYTGSILVASDAGVTSATFCLAKVLQTKP